ncbi:MAG: 5'/3'-nucleotidase SurE, partial [Dehalococcoidia bacterium]
NAVRDLGEVTVVAPANNQSGVGAANSFRKSVKINQVASLVPGIDAYAVSGTPADSVILGIEHVLPNGADVVVSGINPGYNTSRNMFISGTFGAAIIAAAKGVKTCAFSIEAEGIGAAEAEAEIRTRESFGNELIGRIITAVGRELISPETPAGGLFNVNIPRPDGHGIAGAVACAPAYSDFKMKLYAQDDGGYEIYSGLKLVIDQLDLTPGTDVEALIHRNVAVTAVEGATLSYLPEDPTLHRMVAAVNREIG